MDIAAGTAVNIANTGGAFAGTNYRINLSGGPTGTFNIDQGASGNGNYTYTRTASNAATLRLDYTSPVQGEWDRLDMNFSSRDAGSFTGAQNVDGGNGVFTERNDFAGTFTNFTPNNNPQ